MTATGSHVRTNRRSWDKTAESYERRHRRSLAGKDGLAWGLWRIPEAELRLLEDTRGRRILELGCGAARWSVGLARTGGRPVGLDVSRARLAQAAAEVRRARCRVPLVQASAERLPFRDRSFDLVFCDWGAMTFADPDRTVPECSRVLEAGGLLAFSTSSPFRYVTFDPKRDRQDTRLHQPYFVSGGVRLGDQVEFPRPYGEWIDLFHASGFRLERLVETRPPGGRSTSYLSRHDNRWAGRWPTEVLWKLRRQLDPPAPSARQRPRRRHH